MFFVCTLERSRCTAVDTLYTQNCEYLLVALKYFGYVHDIRDVDVGKDVHKLLTKSKQGLELGKEWLRSDFQSSTWRFPIPLLPNSASWSCLFLLEPSSPVRRVSRNLLMGACTKSQEAYNRLLRFRLPGCILKHPRCVGDLNGLLLGPHEAICRTDWRLGMRHLIGIVCDELYTHFYLD